MLAASWLKEMLGEHFNFYLLAAVLSIIAAGVAASLLAPAREDPAGGGSPAGH
ncbi:hypothetical protein D3C83_327760 [compost metagenome]